jgi:uncharacterized glyoxalase superfamily protein PhnB
MNPNIFPALKYHDSQAALEFLTKVFGFEEVRVYRAEDGSIGHAELRLGAGMIMFGGPPEAGWLGGGTPDPLAGTVSIYVVVADPRAHYEHARAGGATIVRDLESMDYGSLEYSARDPEGNLWSFGSYDPLS